jgi:hypothetical protein
MSTLKNDTNRENAHHSTGPGTPEGEAMSAQNAARDFVLPEELAEYETARDRIWKEIAPSGILEETFALCVITATWRLRRCGLVEALMVETIGSGLDPMEDELGARRQDAVDRARMSAHKLLCQSLGELRRLRTDRITGSEIFAGSLQKPKANLVSWDQVLRAVARSKRVMTSPPPVNNSIKSQIHAEIDAEQADLAPFCDGLDSAA